MGKYARLKLHNAKACHEKPALSIALVTRREDSVDNGAAHKGRIESEVRISSPMPLPPSDWLLSDHVSREALFASMAKTNLADSLVLHNGGCPRQGVRVDGSCFPVVLEM
jgi:hypothetical protein